MDFIYEDEKIYSKDAEGKLLAQVTFPLSKEGYYDINHTFVHPSVRGQGIADQLLSAAVKKIQQSGKKAHATCSYAKKWEGLHPEYSDLFV